MTLDHIDPICFLSLVIHWLHALFEIPKPYTYRIWVHTWLAMLSHVVMSIIQVFHLL
jgi:hypothetical protein